MACHSVTRDDLRLCFSTFPFLSLSFSAFFLLLLEFSCIDSSVFLVLFFCSFSLLIFLDVLGVFFVDFACL